MSDKPAAKPADAKDAKGGKSKLMIIVAAVVLLGGAGGGYFWYSKKQAAAAEAAAAAAGEDEEVAADKHASKASHGDTSKKKKKKKKKGSEEKARVMAFEPFVVNLADPGVARFLRTSIQLVVTGGEEGGGGEGEGKKKGASVEELRARSAIIELLSAETSDKLLTGEGKAELKEHIIERMEDVLGDAEIEVEDVLFSDFVIQF